MMSINWMEKVSREVDRMLTVQEIMINMSMMMKIEPASSSIRIRMIRL